MQKNMVTGYSFMEKKYQIFISSTYEDLKEERKKVQDTILSMYQFPIGMEMFSAAEEEQWEIIRETIDSSDYYVLIIGHRYGSVIKEGEYAGISYTQKEFRYALKQKIPVLAFLIDDSVPIILEKIEQDEKKRKKLNAFKEEVKNGRMVQWWTSKDDLANKVMNSLNKQIRKGNRPGWVRADGIGGLDPSKTIDLQKIMNELHSDNIIEFEVFIKYVKNVWDYRVKFKNKVISYIEKSKICEKELIAKRGLSERDFYSNYHEELEYEWFYIGSSIETFCTKLGIEYAAIANEEKIRYDYEYETAYKNYLIQSAWEELEKIENDRKFVYGVYVLSKMLHGEKQNILKEDFEKLIKELVNRNYYLEKEVENDSDSNDVKKNSGKKGNISYMDSSTKLVVNGGQINIANGHATVQAIQNNSIDADELDGIIKGIKENLCGLRQGDADKIVDVVEMAKEELTKQKPKVSKLNNCSTLIVSMFTIANEIPALVSNLQRLQEFIWKETEKHQI